MFAGSAIPLFDQDLEALQVLRLSELHLTFNNMLLHSLTAISWIPHNLYMELCLQKTISHLEDDMKRIQETLRLETLATKKARMYCSEHYLFPVINADLCQV